MCVCVHVCMCVCVCVFVFVFVFVFVSVCVYEEALLRVPFQGGLKPKRYESVRRDIVQQYGFNTMLGLDNLQRLGLLKPYERGAPVLLNMAAARTKLKLAMEPSAKFDCTPLLFLLLLLRPCCSRTCTHRHNPRLTWSPAVV